MKKITSWERLFQYRFCFKCLILFDKIKIEHEKSAQLIQFKLEKNINTIIRQNLLWTNGTFFNSISLYGAILGMNSMSQVRPRGQAMPEQVKEIQKNQPFPLNQGFSTAGLHPGNGS
jgi:hypothetical protein